MENEKVKQKSGFATAALVLGIIGAVLAFIPIINNVAFILGVLALIFAIISLCKKSSIGIAAAGMILAIAAIVITIVMQMTTVKAISDAVNDATSEFSYNMDNITGENTEDILKNDADVVVGAFQIIKGDFIDEYKLPVKVKNKSNGRKSFSVKIEAVDASGARIDDDTVYVNDLNAGQEQNLEAFVLVTSDMAGKLKNAQFKIVEISMY